MMGQTGRQLENPEQATSVAHDKTSQVQPGQALII